MKIKRAELIRDPIYYINTSSERYCIQLPYSYLLKIEHLITTHIYVYRYSYSKTWS